MFIIYSTLFNCFAEVAHKGVIAESDVVVTSDSNADEMNTDGKPYYLYSFLQPHFVLPHMNLTIFTCIYIPLQRSQSQMKYQSLQSQMKYQMSESDKRTVESHEQPVLMDLDDENDVFDHDAYAKCDACTVLLHYIPPNPEIYQPQSIFIFLSLDYRLIALEPRLLNKFIP